MLLQVNLHGPMLTTFHLVESRPQEVGTESTSLAVLFLAPRMVPDPRRHSKTVCKRRKLIFNWSAIA